MTYDYTYLYQALVRENCSLPELARLLHLSQQDLKEKLASRQDFTQQEIQTCAQILHLKPEKLHLYFFTIK